jgi:hypothetical protein
MFSDIHDFPSALRRITPEEARDFVRKWLSMKLDFDGCVLDKNGERMEWTDSDIQASPAGAVRPRSA